MIVAAMKFARPQRTFVLGADFCPKGLLKIFPAAPNTKCGTPFPKRNPRTKYQIRNSCKSKILQPRKWRAESYFGGFDASAAWSSWAVTFGTGVFRYLEPRTKPSAATISPTTAIADTCVNPKRIPRHCRAPYHVISLQGKRSSKEDQ